MIGRAKGFPGQLHDTLGNSIGLHRVLRPRLLHPGDRHILRFRIRKGRGHHLLAEGLTIERQIGLGDKGSIPGSNLFDMGKKANRHQ